MSPSRSYSGPAFDAIYQYITERPSLEEQEEETVYATEPETVGEERSENVPVPEEESTPEPDLEGQTTLEDWGWSA